MALIFIKHAKHTAHSSGGHNWCVNCGRPRSQSFQAKDQCCTGAKVGVTNAKKGETHVELFLILTLDQGYFGVYVVPIAAILLTIRGPQIT
jgi:hypothetical protein